MCGMGVWVVWGAVFLTLVISGEAHGGDHLVISEFCVTPTNGEFVEIYNPTGDPIDLSNYYLADYIRDNDNDYINIVDSTDTGWWQDFLAHFPAGATIDPGGFQTIAMNDSFVSFYGIAPTYELTPDGVPDGDQIPDMVSAGAGGIGSQTGLSNAGESLVLFYWDGISDLVHDVDYVVWGDKVEAICKTGEMRDSKTDDDSDSTAYQPDTPIVDQAVVDADDDGDPEPHSNNMSAQRADPNSEAAEGQSGGNGITGHDETSEDLSVAGGSWTLDCDPTPNGAPPSGGVEEEGICGPSHGLSLDRTYPNPFSEGTVIRYTIVYQKGREERVVLCIHDLTGRLICTLVDGHQKPGTHVVYWNGNNSASRSVSAGVYFCRLEQGDLTRTSKMVLVR